MNELLEDLRYVRTLYARLRDWLCQSLTNNTHSWKYDDTQTAERIRRRKTFNQSSAFSDIRSMYFTGWDTAEWSGETGNIKTRTSHCRICGVKRWESVSDANGYVEKIQGD